MVFILAFIGSITEVPMASILLQDVNNLTLAVGAQQYLYPQNYLWGDFAAAAVLSGFPITVVFLLAQRWLVGGLTAGGVKVNGSWPGADSPAITICKDSRAELDMAEVVLNNVRKITIRLSTRTPCAISTWPSRKGSSSSSSARPVAASPPCCG